MTAMTPTDCADFERVLDAEPDNWTLRLVYADWLDERETEVPCGNCHGDGQVWHERDWDSSWPCPKCHGSGRVSNGYADLARAQRWMAANRKRPMLHDNSRIWDWWNAERTSSTREADLNHSLWVTLSGGKVWMRDRCWGFPTRVAAERALAAALSEQDGSTEALNAAGEAS
jgi:uncharacterized protein (TIGR02996 family)